MKNVLRIFVVLTANCTKTDINKIYKFWELVFTFNDYKHFKLDKNEFRIEVKLKGVEMKYKVLNKKELQKLFQKAFVRAI